MGTQELGPNEYKASFYIEPWSGGISTVQVVDGGSVIENESTLNSAAYPSPFLQGLIGFYAISYPTTGHDVQAVFTNVWGEKTTIDLGSATASAPLTNLIPATTAAAFGIAAIAWLILSGALKTRKAGVH